MAFKIKLNKFLIISVMIVNVIFALALKSTSKFAVTFIDAWTPEKKVPHTQIVVGHKAGPMKLTT